MNPSNIPIIETAGDSVFWYFFQQNPVPMWLFNVETLRFVRINPAAIAKYGYTEEEFLSMTIKDIRPSEDMPRVEERVKINPESFKTSEPWRHIKRDGRVIWVDISSFSVIYNGNKARMVTAVDVTQTVEQTIALANANRELAKLSLVATLTGNSVLILNAQRNILWVNKAFTELTGYTLAEVIGKKPSSFLHGPQSSQETTRIIQDAIDAGKPFTVEIVHYTRHGKQLWILADGQPVPQEENNPAEYIIVETDITELKEQQAALKSSERQMNVFFEGTDSLHILFDRNLKIITFNQVAQEFAIKKLKRTLAAGESMLNIVSESTQQRFLRFAKEALKGNATINREAEIPLDNGEPPAWWIISDIPAYDSFGNVMGVAFTAYDITGRKRYEERIKKQSGIFNDIAWKQSHLVRAPLANILSLANLLQTEGCDLELISALNNESKKLDDIITGIVYNTIEERKSHL